MSRGLPRRTTAAMPASRRPARVPITALVIVLAAAVGGAGSWYAVRTTPSARLTTLVTPPAAGNSPSPPSRPAFAISLAPPAALYPEAALIQPVIAAYFRAINSRDYAGYLATQDLGHALTAQQFQAGFRSTEDSDVLVTSIAIGGDGRPAADVTFTSRQQPRDGPGGESCTDWHLTMFFDTSAGTYTLGTPPADYRASYQACS